nr:reverse transcriptase [Tanacetum cinerariifolium]
MRIGYENDNRMELFIEHHGYDVLQYNHNDNLASDNEQSDVNPDYDGESDSENVDSTLRIRPFPKKDEAYGVNLIERSRVCNLWDISGIPCVHAVTSYMHLHMDPDLGVSSCRGGGSTSKIGGGSVGRGGGTTSKRGGGSGLGRGGGSTSKKGSGLGLGRAGGSVGRGGGSTSKRGGGSSVGRAGRSVGRGGRSKSGGSVGRGAGSVGRVIVKRKNSLGKIKKQRGKLWKKLGQQEKKERLENEQYSRTYCDWEDLQWEGDGFEEPNLNLRLATMSDLLAANEAHDECFNNMPSLTNDFSLDVSHNVEGNNDALLNNGAVSLNVALPINMAVHNNVVVPNNEQPIPDVGQTSSQSSKVVLHLRPRSERIAKRRKGQWVDNPDQLHKLIRDHFAAIYLTSGQRNFSNILDMLTPMVTNTISMRLEAPSLQVEIDKAVKNLGSHKALGEDGFHGMFFQKYWHIVGDAVSKAIKQFFDIGIIYRLP